MMQKIRLKCLACILILFLTPKLGLEMYFHQLLHEQNFSSSGFLAHQTRLSQNCSCVEDALMPLTLTTNPEIPVPLREVALFYSEKITPVHAISGRYSLMRGPPLG